MSAPRLGALDIAAALGQPPPTPQQRAVIEAPLEPVLVVAGAGSGKTETMTSRVVWLVANGLVPVEQVLGLTFTRKAAGELAERVRRRLQQLGTTGLWVPEPGEDGTATLTSVPTISTYHAYAGRLVGEHGLRLGIEPDTRLLSEAGAWQLVDGLVARYDGPLDELGRQFGEKVPARSTLVAACLHLSGELAEHVRTVEDLEQHLDAVITHLEGLPDVADPAASRGRPPLGPARSLEYRLRARRALVPILRDYARLKRERDLLDFADQMALAARLAAADEQVRELERQRYRVVLLDEYQDTSEAQLVLLASLFAQGPQASPVMAVGDPNQSIYGWRGASATTLGRFPQEFPRADGSPAEVLGLSTSWRNDEVVLAAANAVSAPLREGSPVPVPRLVARPGAGEGRLDLASFETIEAEAQGVARWIAAERGRGGVLRSAAVLCRKRSQFEPVIAALEQAGLPVEVVGLGGLLRAPEVLDLVALLAVVDDPGRGDRLMRLLAGPVLRLGARDLAALSDWSELLRRRVEGGQRTASTDPAPDGVPALEHSASDAAEPLGIVEALDQFPPPEWVSPDGRELSDIGRERLRWLREVVTSVRALAGIGLPEVVLEAQRLLGLDVEVLSRPGGPRARAHLDRFVDIAADFASGAQLPSLSAFLAWLEAAEVHERGLAPAAQEPDPSAVSVLTVHAAKGLEWDVVAVPGLVEATFPAYEHARARADGAGGWTIAEPTDAGWVSGHGDLPYDLRGDRDGLPRLDWAGVKDRASIKAAVESFRAEGGRHGLVEERRLAYVAFTRARTNLLLSSHVWGSGSAPRLPSRFLTEVAQALTGDPRVQVGPQAALPDSTADCPNPRDDLATAAVWPVAADPTGVAQRAAEVVDRYRGAGRPPRDPLADEAARLLRERAEQTQARPTVELPPHLTTSALVQLAADADRFALDLRRPMPAPPAHSARRGTAFHAWVEAHYGEPAMLDLDELPGSADDGAVDEGDLEQMQERFLASEWAAREPLEIERSVEMVVDGIAVRGRIDAVFGRGDGGVTIVDWKTGAEPSPAVARSRAVQLSAYRIAYARLTGRSLDEVDAAFFYASTGRTVRPQLLDVEQLRAVLPPDQGR